MLNIMKASRFAAAAVLATALSLGSAKAATITVDGEGSETGTLLQAIFDIRFVEEAIASIYTFSLTITNVGLGELGDNILTGFALSSNPASSYYDDDSSVFSYVAGDSLEAGVTNNYDFCFESDSNGNCNGGNPSGGLAEGESLTFDLSVFAESMPNFFGAAARWQEVGFDNEDSGTGMGVVPLPAAGWLMLGALGGLAALRRKRKAA